MKQKLLIKRYTSKNSKMLNSYLNRRDLVKYKYLGKGTFETIALNSDDKEDGSKGTIISLYDILGDGLETYLYKVIETEVGGVFLLTDINDGLVLKRVINGNLQDYPLLFIIMNDNIFISKKEDFLNTNNSLIKEANSINAFRSNVSELIWNIGEGEIVNIELFFKFDIKYLYFDSDNFSDLSLKIDQLFINNKIIVNNNKLQKNLLLINGNKISITLLKGAFDEFTLDLSNFMRIFTDFNLLSYSVDLSTTSSSVTEFTKIPTYTLNDFLDFIYLSSDINMTDIISNKRHKQIPFIQTLSRFNSIMHYRYQDRVSNKDSYSSKYLNGFKLLGIKPTGVTPKDDALISREHKVVSNIRIDNKLDINKLKSYINLFYGYTGSLSVFHSGEESDDITYTDFKQDYLHGVIVLFQEVKSSTVFNKLFISLNVNSIECFIEDNNENILVTLKQLNNKLIIEQIDSSLENLIPYIIGDIVGGVDYTASGLYLNKDFMVSIDSETLGSELIINAKNVPVTSGKEYRSYYSLREVEYLNNNNNSNSHYLSINTASKNVIRDTTCLLMIDYTLGQTNQITVTFNTAGNISVFLEIKSKLIEYISEGVYQIDHEFSDCADCSAYSDFKVYYYINEGKLLLINEGTGFSIKSYKYTDVFIPSLLNPKSINNNKLLSNARTIRNKPFNSHGGARYASRFVDTYFMDRIVYNKKMMFKSESRIPIKKIVIEYPELLSTKNFLIKLKYHFKEKDIKVVEKDNSFNISIRNTSILSGVNNWIIVTLYYINALTEDEKKIVELGNLDIKMIE